MVSQGALEKEKKREQAAAAKAARKAKRREAELEKMEAIVAPERPPSPAAKAIPMVERPKISAKDRWKKAAAKMSAMARLSLPITRNIPGVPDKVEDRRGVGLFKVTKQGSEPPKRSKLHEALNPAPLHYESRAQKEERESYTASGFGHVNDLPVRDDAGNLIDDTDDESDDEDDVDPDTIAPLEELAPGLSAMREKRNAEELQRRATLRAQHQAAKAEEEAKLAEQRTRILEREKQLRSAATEVTSLEDEEVTGFDGIDVGDFTF